jgi:hypothetical protein
MVGKDGRSNTNFTTIRFGKMSKAEASYQQLNLENSTSK